MVFEVFLVAEVLLSLEVLVGRGHWQSCACGRAVPGHGADLLTLRRLAMALVGEVAP